MIQYFLKHNWQLIAIATLIAVIAGLGYYITLLNAQKGTLVAEKNTLVAELGVSQASVKSLTVAIEDQNIAIEKLKTDADARLKKAQQEILKARAATASAKARAEELLGRTVPQGASQCDAANNLFNEEIRRAKK
jgi:peptidoglycan hydrolase CwlO-like protein